jgi:hypothetical protein
MKERDFVRHELCVELLVSMCLTVLFGLNLTAYHYLRGTSVVAEANRNYASFFDSIVEPVPGAAADRCEGQSNTPAIVRRLRRSPTLAELERLFGPSTIEPASGSGHSDMTPDTTVEVHSWDGRLKAEFYVRTPASTPAWRGRGRVDITRVTISGLMVIEFENERVGQSPDAWRKYCDAPVVDFDLIAQVTESLIRSS